MRVGDETGDLQYKGFVSFDTSSLLDTATIVSTTLQLTRGTLRGTNPFTTHGAAYADISTGGFGGVPSLTASDFQAVATATQVATMSNAAQNGDVLRRKLLVSYIDGASGIPPAVTITAPPDGSSFTEGTSIDFTGTAPDAEEGDLSGSLSWMSSIDGAIGSGSSFSTVLSVGTHTIDASVTDSDGSTNVRGRRLGYTAVALLKALESGHRYGLDMMAATGLPSGTVYPTLGRLEKRGLVRAKWESA